MKKLLSIVVVLCIAISTSVFGYDLDLTTLSDEEILQLKEDVNSEIKNRNIEAQEEFTIGFYEVGKDISAGHYTFSFLDGSHGCLLDVYSSMDDYTSQKELFDYGINKDHNASFDLEDGQVLGISIDNVLVSKTSKSVFAP